MLNFIRGLFGHARSAPGHFKTTPDGRYLFANAELARIYRYPSPEHMMIALRDIQQQLYVDPVRRLQFVFQMQRDGQVQDFRSEIFCADRTRIWITENARCVKDAAGALVYYEGTVEALAGAG